MSIVRRRITALAIAAAALAGPAAAVAVPAFTAAPQVSATHYWDSPVR